MEPDYTESRKTQDTVFFHVQSFLFPCGSLFHLCKFYLSLSTSDYTNMHALSRFHFKEQIIKVNFCFTIHLAMEDAISKGNTFYLYSQVSVKNYPMFIHNYSSSLLKPCNSLRSPVASQEARCKENWHLMHLCHLSQWITPSFPVHSPLTAVMTALLFPSLHC